MAGPLAVTSCSSTIYQDNSACLSQATLPKMTPPTKHITVAYHLLREYVLSSVLCILKIDTAVNPANIFTKGLVAEKFTAIRKLVCGWWHFDSLAQLRGKVKYQLIPLQNFGSHVTFLVPGQPAHYGYSTTNNFLYLNSPARTVISPLLLVSIPAFSTCPFHVVPRVPGVRLKKRQVLLYRTDKQNRY